MTKIGGAAVGGAVGQASNKVLGKLNPKIGAGVKILVGAIGPEVVKGDFMAEMGSGLIGVGAAELTRNMVPALAGIGENWQVDNSLGAFDEDYASEYDMSGIGNDYSDEDNAIGDVGEENLYDD